MEHHTAGFAVRLFLAAMACASVGEQCAAATLTSLSPNSVAVNGPAFTLTVNGSGFVNGSTVQWNYSPLTTNYVGTTQLTASVPASLIDLDEYGEASVITVADPSGRISNGLTFGVNGPGPVASSPIPIAATAGGPAFTIMVGGFSFVSGSVVNWNGSPLATTYVSPILLTAFVPASLIAAVGTVPVSVLNPGGVASPAVTPFQILATSPGTITFSDLTNPATVSDTTGRASVGCSPFLTDFQRCVVAIAPPGPSGAVPGVYLNNPTQIIQPGSGLITAELLPNIHYNSSDSSGTVSIEFDSTGFAPFVPFTQEGWPAPITTNGGIQVAGQIFWDSGGKIIAVDTIQFQVGVLPTPTIGSLGPSNAAAGGSEFTLTVNGSGFLPGSVVLWNGLAPGSALTTTYVSGTELTASVPANLIANIGGDSVIVANPGYTFSNALTFTVGPPVSPSIVSVSPSSGSGTSQTFTLEYADALGATDLSTVWVWFTSSFNASSSANSCIAYYARATNQIFLLNDAGTVWSSPAAPGAAVTLSNSQCSVNAAQASVTPSGTNLILNLPVTFAPLYAGTKSTYMFAAGSSANSGWQQMGSWIVPGAVAAVSAVSVTPSGGSAAQQTFALEYADSMGATELSAVWVWFTSNFNTVSSANSCIAYYARATNQILLINDAGTAYTPATPGSAVTLSNSNCSINALTATVTLSGMDLTVNLPVTFAAGFAGTKSIFMFALGSTANSGWQSMGTWTVPLSSSTAPVSVTPGSGAGLSQTFALLYADPLGATDLTNLWVWFTSTFNTVSSANSCIAYYVRTTNQVNLINDAGTAILSSAAPGAAVTLSNSQCSINAAAATVVPSGIDLTVNLPVTFTAGYAGAKGIFMYASGLSANSGWQSMGTWTVP